MTIISHSFDITHVVGLGRNSRLPGGPPSLTGTVLQQQADALSAGQWHVFSGETAIGLPSGFETFSSAYLYRSLGNSSDMWGPVHDWHPTLKRSFCIVDRTSLGEPYDMVAFGGYDAENHKWDIYSLPAESEAQLGRYIGAPHVYSGWCLARDKNMFYRPRGELLHRYNLATGTWDNINITGGMGGGHAYLEGSGEIISLLSSGEVRALDVETGITRSVGTFAGYTGRDLHIHGDCNTVRGEVMLLSDTREFCIVDSTGIVQTGTMPIEAYGVDGAWRHSAMFYDPITGHYLVANRAGGVLWEYDPDADAWAQAFNASAIGFPWPNYDGFSIAVVPELNVILWFDRANQRVYKHQAVL